MIQEVRAMRGELKTSQRKRRRNLVGVLGVNLKMLLEDLKSQHQVNLLLLDKVMSKVMNYGRNLKMKECHSFQELYIIFLNL